MGIDPIHFGIVMVVNLAIGYVTPPLGINLFIACNISKLRIEDLVVRLVPFLVTLIVALLILTYVPQITLFLPHLLGM
jgi:C4-dicarboxylate transporter DctM subunit